MWASTATESSYIEPRRALRNVPFFILTLEYDTDSHRKNPIVFSKKVMDFRVSLRVILGLSLRLLTILFFICIILSKTVIDETITEVNL